MTQLTARQQHLANYRDGHRQLTNALARFPQEMWTFKPAPDRWSIAEIVGHLTDFEAVDYVRLRKVVAEPGQDLPRVDQAVWAHELNYHEQSLGNALELFKHLRAMSATLLERLPEEAFGREGVWPGSGPRTLDVLLGVWAGHVAHHIKQMERTHDAWLTIQAETASARL